MIDPNSRQEKNVALERRVCYLIAPAAKTNASSRKELANFIKGQQK